MESIQVVLKQTQDALTRGEFPQAETRCRDALARFGPRADILANLGIVLLAQGRFDAASSALAGARNLSPDHPGVLANLGLALLRAERPVEAIAALERAVELGATNVDALNNLGLARAAMGDVVQAAAAFERALDQSPSYVPALSNWCDLLISRGELDAARDLTHRFVTANPDNAGAWFKYGYVLVLAEDFAAAELALRRSATLNSDYAPTFHNLATVALWQNRLDDAVAHFREAIAVDSGYAEARFGLGCALLKLRRSEEGWQEFEARRAVHALETGRVPARFNMWDGRPAPEGTLLVLPEEGLGDVLQFVRFVADAKARVHRVIFSCPDYWAPLRQLIAGAPGVDAVVGRDGGAVEISAVCNLLSLPHLLGLGDAAFEARGAYLSPPKPAAQRWGARLDAYKGLRVGLCWAGSPRWNDPFASRIDARRSIGLDRLCVLGDIPGVHFFSLQKGAIAATRLSRLRLQDWTSELEDFGETAALIANLDLVISVDTSIVHCTGALGRPIWMLDRYDNCWRWGTDAAAPGWYRNLRVFRQSRFGEWESVVEQLRAALIEEVAQRC